MEAKHPPNKNQPVPGALWRLPRVEHETGLMKSTLYKLMSEDKFPRNIRLSARCVAWNSQAVMAWCEDLIKSGGAA